MFNFLENIPLSLTLGVLSRFNGYWFKVLSEVFEKDPEKLSEVIQPLLSKSDSLSSEALEKVWNIKLFGIKSLKIKNKGGFGFCTNGGSSYGFGRAISGSGPGRGYGRGRKMISSPLTNP